MGGGNSQCDWDNFFAAMMQGSDSRGRDLGFVGYVLDAVCYVYTCRSLIEISLSLIAGLLRS